MGLYNAVSAKCDIIFYEKGVFVDMRTVSKKTATSLKSAFEFELNTGGFDNMTRIVEVSIKNRYGSLEFDADNDEDIDRFLECWVFPFSRELVDGWTVVISMNTKTVHDMDGNVSKELSW